MTDREWPPRGAQFSRVMKGGPGEASCALVTRYFYNQFLENSKLPLQMGEGRRNNENKRYYEHQCGSC